MSSVLSLKDIEDRINGCWLGKSLGGAIGATHEGQAFWIDLPRKYPVETVGNDYLDLRLVWLHLLEQKGLAIDAQDVAEGWLRHIAYPFDEYGVAAANLRLGLKPPHTGISHQRPLS